VGEGFETRPVTTGQGDRLYVEIESGMESGQRYVVKGAFTLKAQLSKGAFGDGHGH
jgi:cobalt-zinc-cadmium efflux system membrane fusion protein